MTKRYIEICEALINTNKNGIILYKEIEKVLNEEELSDYFIISSMLDYFSDKDITVVMPENNLIEKEEKEIEFDEDFKDSSDAIKWYLKNLPEEILTADEEKELVKKAHTGDIQARNKMINHNLRLVVNIAKNFYKKSKNKNNCFEFLDYIQAGNLGLMKAIEKFDPELDFKFSTYATYWIRQHIIRSLSDFSRTIRMPVHAIEQHRYILKAKDILEKAGIKPTYENIADYLNEHGMVLSISKITGEKVQKNLNLYNTTDATSLETPINAEEDTLLMDFVADYDTDIEEQAERNDLKNTINFILENSLSNREADVLCRRFGIHGTQDTLETIAKDYDLTRERIRQIEITAKRKFKRAYRRLVGRDFA